MKILVTGAAGFVGSNVIEYLTAHYPGHKIVATSRNAEKASKCTWFNNAEFIPFDHHGFDAGTDLYRHFGSPDLMIHLAWSFLPMFKAPEHLTTELPAQVHFLSNMIGNGLKNLTCSGTCYEYGLQEGRLSEDDPCHPVVPYASAKLELLHRLIELQKQHPFNLTWARLFFMYGKGQSEKSLIPQLDKAIQNGDKVFNMSKGDQSRDYLPIEKVAENISKLALMMDNNGVVNCCNGKPVTVRELVEEHVRKRNHTITLNAGFYPYPDYEPFAFWGNDEKLKRLINS